MSSEMTPTQNLHYAIGELAYAVACADGSIQKEERQKFQDIVKSELEQGHHVFDIASIIFQIMDKDKVGLMLTYEMAMKQIRVNSHYLSPELKEKFIRVMERVAEAYPPVTSSEEEIVKRFKRDIAEIHGDPIYYNK
jgi:uncharacterized tellurite resistance protein B-like protein